MRLVRNVERKTFQAEPSLLLGRNGESTWLRWEPGWEEYRLENRYFEGSNSLCGGENFCGRVGKGLKCRVSSRKSLKCFSALAIYK